MGKYITGFIAGIILSGVVGALTVPTYLHNQRMQGQNEGALNAKAELADKITKHFGTFEGSEFEDVLFSIKTTRVLIVQEDNCYSLKVEE